MAIAGTSVRVCDFVYAPSDSSKSQQVTKESKENPGGGGRGKRAAASKKSSHGLEGLCRAERKIEGRGKRVREWVRKRRQVVKLLFLKLFPSLCVLCSVREKHKSETKKLLRD